MKRGGKRGSPFSFLHKGLFGGKRGGRNVSRFHLLSGIQSKRRWNGAVFLADKEWEREEKERRPIARRQFQTSILPLLLSGEGGGEVLKRGNFREMGGEKEKPEKRGKKKRKEAASRIVFVQSTRRKGEKKKKFLYSKDPPRISRHKPGRKKKRTNRKVAAVRVQEKKERRKGEEGRRHCHGQFQTFDSLAGGRREKTSIHLNTEGWGGKEARVIEPLGSQGKGKVKGGGDEQMLFHFILEASGNPSTIRQGEEKKEGKKTWPEFFHLTSSSQSEETKATPFPKGGKERKCQKSISLSARRGIQAKPAILCRWKRKRGKGVNRR